MHKKLIKSFIKDANNVENTHVRNNYGTFSAIVGIVSNMLLFLVKIILGTMFKSISILADAINNLTDSVSSIVTLLGFKLAAKPADKQHPFGHARYETISGLLVGVIVVYVGIEFVSVSIKEILNPTAVKTTSLVVLILLATVLIKLWQFSFNRYVGKKINSNVILTTAIDSRNDMLITILVLFGVIIEYLFKIKVDGYVGFVLAFVIICSGISAMRNTVDELLGKRPESKMIKDIENLLQSYSDTLGYHDLVIHQYGHNQYFATVHMEIDAKLDLIRAHDIINEIEDDFLNRLNINLVVHTDPVILDDPIIHDYWKTIKKIVTNYKGANSFHDFRLVAHKDYNVIIFDLVVNQNEVRSDIEIIEDLSKIINEVYKNDQIEIIINSNYLA